LRPVYEVKLAQSRVRFVLPQSDLLRALDTFVGLCSVKILPF